MEYLRPLFLLIAILIVTACGGGDSDPSNSNPTADAGPDQTVTEGDFVRLDGTFNIAGGMVTLSWTQTSGAAVTLSSTAAANPSFSAPMVSATEALAFTLTVTDSNGVSTADTVVITVNDSSGNNPPIVDAGPGQAKVEGTTVQLAGSGSDPDGVVTFSWTQTSGTAVTLSDTTIVNPTFVAPMVTNTEVLVFTLTVTDVAMASVMDSVSITVTDSATGGGATETYLFYARGLNAVDPVSPASPIEVEPVANIVNSFENLATLRSIEAGTYDSTTQTLTDLHTHAVIYAHTDGNIYKVSALKSDPLTPVRVSNESMADQLCSEGRAHFYINDPTIADFSNVDNSQFFYVLPGVDNTCDTDDDVWKMVRLGMSVTDAPVIAKPTITELTNLATGAISGWLVHDFVAGELQRCDASFAGCSAITTVGTNIIDSIAQSNNFILLEIDNQLFVYTIDTDTLSSALFTIPTGTYLGDYRQDSNTVYFSHGSLIYQLPVDGSAMATVLTTESGDIQSLGISNNSVVYQLGGSGSNSEIKSVPKAGGTPVSLVTATGTDNLSILFAKNNLVYYNVQNMMPNGTVPVAAGVIDDDGMNQTEIMTAAWTGIIFATTWNLNNLLTFGDLVEKVILTEGYDIVGTSGGYAGATIKSVDAITKADIATLGSLPITDHLPGLFCFGVGDDNLCSVNFDLSPTPTPPASPSQLDLFYLNAGTDNSLARVTNTASESEQPVW